MKFSLAVASLITVMSIASFAEETASQNTKTKTPVSYEQTMKNYANKTKEVQKDLDKAAKERQKQLEATDKALDSN
ncbi:hypothetical protein ACLSU7_07060 [Bdellovibrio sp. HCB185ZH]|uniref:hypothetical protein n=1 Tax=Bdellovibrio sp. HCB185ZH TaxID=3394235 RepID=UPI0039A49346